LRVPAGRLRHAGRAVRGAHARADEEGHQVPGGAAGQRVLGRALRLDREHRPVRRQDRREGPRAAPPHRRRRRRGEDRAGGLAGLGGGALKPLSVCVYCGSIEGLPESYLRLAADVGGQIAARGWQLVSGGGRAAMMGALGAAARAGGARTVGVIPQALVEREWADHESDELLVVDTMRERKALMEAHADAFLALPGGVGTCEELFEVWTAGYLGMHRK